MVGPQWFRSGQVRLYARLLRASAKRAIRVFVPSQQVADELNHMGVREGRIRLLRTAVDESFVLSSAEAVMSLRSRLGLERDYLVMLGCYDARKDAATAIAAHVEAARTHPHDLVLVGREHPIFAPVTLPASPTVKRAGYLPDGDLPALLTGAAALVFPSRYEGFGLPPVEAMSCGTPALVSDLPAVRESTWGLAQYLPVGEAGTWAAAIRDVLDDKIVAPPAVPAWTRADMAGQFLAGLEGFI